MIQEVWGVDRFIEPDEELSPIEGCDCQPDVDDLYDRWRDAQDEAE